MWINKDPLFEAFLLTMGYKLLSIWKSADGISKCHLTMSLYHKNTSQNATKKQDRTN